MNRSFETRLLSLITRTRLHIGGTDPNSPIDQPVQRERHTGLPVIPGSAIKGTFADAWTEVAIALDNQGQQKLQDGQPYLTGTRNGNGTWLFGAEHAENASAGAVQFSEARLLAFPVRSAKGGFAWVTSPLVLARLVRDGGLASSVKIPEELSAGSVVLTANDSPLLFGGEKGSRSVVLEDYALTRLPDSVDLPSGLVEALAGLLPADPVWTKTGITKRLAIVSDGLLSFFARAACEITTHVRIEDATGAADPGGLYNQEDVPSEAVFYSPVTCWTERSRRPAPDPLRTPSQAFDAMSAFLKSRGQALQFGADASTGLGYCTIHLGSATGTGSQPSP